MNEVEAAKKQALQQAMGEMEFHPVFVEGDVSVANYAKIPLSRLPALGTAFEPLAVAAQNVFGSGATTQLCKVTIPSGTHLASFKNGVGNLGTVLDANNQITGQAVLNPLTCNPTMIFMAAALANIDKKLDAIHELQQEMMDLLVQKEKAELRGNLTFLADIMNSYKYNWNSDMYKQSNHVKVLDIRQASEQKILFYRQQIIDKTKKKNLVPIDLDVKKQTARLLGLFKDYRLALYTYGFAYFLEVMLLGNFDADYLHSISQKLKGYSIQYKELYTAVYDKVEKYFSSSVQSTVIKGLKTVSKATGEAIGRTPVISRGKVDEALIDVGSRLGQLDSKRMMDTLQKFTNAKDSCVRPFIDNIETVNRLYNQPINVLLDGENIYLGVNKGAVRGGRRE